MRSLVLALCFGILALSCGCANGPFSEDFSVIGPKLDDQKVQALRAGLVGVCEKAGLQLKEGASTSLWYFRSYDPKNDDDRASYLHLLFDVIDGVPRISIRSDCPGCPANAAFAEEVRKVVESVVPTERLRHERGRIIKTFS